MSDEEKHLSSNGVYKPEIASAIANLKVIAKWGGPGVLRASRLRNSARRISAQFSDGPPTASADAKGEGRMPTQEEANSLLSAFGMLGDRSSDIVPNLLLHNVFPPK